MRRQRRTRCHRMTLRRDRDHTPARDARGDLRRVQHRGERRGGAPAGARRRAGKPRRHDRPQQRAQIPEHRSRPGVSRAPTGPRRPRASGRTLATGAAVLRGRRGARSIVRWRDRLSCGQLTSPMRTRSVRYPRQGWRARGSPDRQLPICFARLWQAGVPALSALPHRRDTGPRASPGQ